MAKSGSVTQRRAARRARNRSDSNQFRRDGSFDFLPLNFVLPGVLAGGGSRSLRIDAQGKALGQALLEMELQLTAASEQE